MKLTYIALMALLMGCIVEPRPEEDNRIIHTVIISDTPKILDVDGKWYEAEGNREVIVYSTLLKGYSRDTTIGEVLINDYPTDYDFKFYQDTLCLYLDDTLSIKLIR